MDTENDKKHSMTISEHQKERAIERAQKMGEHVTTKEIDEVDHKLHRMCKGAVAKIWDKVQALWNAWKSPDIPMGTKFALIGCLVYLVTPLDVIPDFLIAIGLLDDAAVIVWGYSLLQKFWDNGGKQAVSTVAGAAVGATAGAVAGATVGGAAGLYASDDQFKKEMDDKIHDLIATKFAEPVRNFISDYVHKELANKQRQMVSNSLLNLVLYLLAIILIAVPVLGKVASSCLAALLIMVAMGFSIYRFVRAFRRNLPIFKSIIKEKSVKQGLFSYFRTTFSKSAIVEQLGDKFNIMGGEPSGNTLDKMFKTMMRWFAVDVVKFVLMWLVIFSTLYIVRYSMLTEVAHVSFFQVLVYPFALAIDSVFHTHLLASLGL